MLWAPQINDRVELGRWFGHFIRSKQSKAITSQAGKDMKHISPIPHFLNRRRLLGRLALGGTASLVLAACGGGGGADDDGAALDLRAAYDRVLEGMDHEEVNKAVGGAPLDVSDFSRGWSSGNQRLYVTFTKMISSGEFYVNGVQWKQIGGGELTKSFNPND
jgi:hypothetical protein